MAFINGFNSSSVTGSSSFTVPAKGGWGWLLLPILLQLVGANIVWGVFMFKLRDPAAAGSASGAVGPVTWSVLQLILLWLAYWRLKRLGRPLWNLIGFEKNRLHFDIILAIGLAVLSTGIIHGSEKLMSLIFPPFGGEGGSLIFPFWAIIWWMSIGSVTAGIGEEAYFRGFLMERFGRFSTIPLLLLSSLFFSLWHLYPPMLFHTFLIGILFGAVYLRTQRLFPVMLAHLLTDTIGGAWMLLFETA